MKLSNTAMKERRLIVKLEKKNGNVFNETS